MDDRNRNLLLNAVRAWFGNAQYAMPVRQSKRTPSALNDRGPQAATAYLTRRHLSAAHTSSLRKLNRAHRIHNGDRPERYEVLGKRERKSRAD